jgi:hypothetical protein
MMISNDQGKFSILSYDECWGKKAALHQPIAEAAQASIHTHTKIDLIFNSNSHRSRRIASSNSFCGN